MRNNRALRLLGTSIGRKLVMAVTGVGLGGFVILHLLGNLTVFQGQEAFNAYAHWMQSLHVLLWVARAGLLGMFLLHVAVGLRLALENRRARPSRYLHPSAHETSSFAGRQMVLTGLCLLAFVVFHLLHLTVGLIDAEHTQLRDPLGQRDVYNAVVLGFQQPALAWSYVVAMLLLGLHLVHGTVSFVQTLGFNHETYNEFVRLGLIVLVAVIVLGNCSIPLSALWGFLEPA